MEWRGKTGVDFAAITAVKVAREHGMGGGGGGIDFTHRIHDNFITLLAHAVFTALLARLFLTLLLQQVIGFFIDAVLA